MPNWENAERCREWGDAVGRIFRDCVGHTSGQGEEIGLTLPETAAFDHIVLQEDIRDGERVRAYVVEARQGDVWHEIAGGTCVGNKRIHRLDIPVVASQLRLRVVQAIVTPQISRLAVYTVS